MMKRLLAKLMTATGFLLVVGMIGPWNSVQAGCNGDICWDDPDPVITARPPLPTPPPHCDPWFTDRPHPTPTPTPPAYDGDLTDVPHPTPTPPPEPDVPGGAQHAYMDCDKNPPEETPPPTDSPEPSESPEPSDEPDEPGKDVEVPQDPELTLQGSGTIFSCALSLPTANPGWGIILMALGFLIPVNLLRKFRREKI